MRVVRVYGPADTPEAETQRSCCNGGSINETKQKTLHEPELIAPHPKTWPASRQAARKAIRLQGSGTLEGGVLQTGCVERIDLRRNDGFPAKLQLSTGGSISGSIFAVEIHSTTVGERDGTRWNEIRCTG